MIWSFCIRRPVLTVVMFLVFGIFGVYGFMQMPVQENPDVDFPIVSVTIPLPGAAPGVVESEVLEPLEGEINTIEGLRTLRSTAQEELGTIVAEFELWRDIDVAAQDVRDAVERARQLLPSDVESPVVRKLEADAQPIMWISLTGDHRWDEVRLTDYIDNTLKQRMETVRGVGQILIGGMREYAVRIRLDPARLAAHGVTAQEVVSAIQAGNVDTPSGRVEGTRREFLIQTRGQFTSAEPFNQLVVAQRDDNLVRLGDVGEAIDGVANDRQRGRFSGEPTVAMGVIRQSDANTVALARALRERLTELAPDFPPGLEYHIGTDASEFIDESINDLLFTVVMATILVMLVVLFFLRSVRGTIVTVLAIPTSLLTALAIISALGFSINVLTMLALILVIGIVIDDAIIVLERAYLHMENGADAEPAARVGTTEVAFPNIANSLALGAVFLPVAFTGGIIGRFFLEFGVTVAVTVFASTLVALTLTPMLCAHVLRVPTQHGRLWQLSERLFTGLERGYRALLAWALRHRLLTVLGGVLAFAIGMVALTLVSKEFAPVQDRAGFVVMFETPQGSTLSETDAFARELERELADLPEVSHQFVGIGLGPGGVGRPNRGQAFVTMTPRHDRERHQVEVMQDLRARLDRIPGGRAFVAEASQGGMQGDPIEVVLQHPDIEELATRQEALMAWMQDRPETYVGVRTDLELNNPQVEVIVDRDRASRLGVSAADISETLRLMFGGVEISKIEVDGKRYDVRTDIVGRGEMVPAALRDLYVRANGQLLALDGLVEIEESIGPSQIQRYNRIRSATISAQVPPGVALGDAISGLEGYLGRTLPSGADWEMAGQSQAFEESFYYLSLAVAFSVVFIFLILAAQFESFLHPLTIIMALPLAMVGAFGALWVLGLPLNVFAFIGLIMLLGLVAKNGIMLVDYTNVLIGRGRTPMVAAQEAAEARFRPVLMTAVSTILGIMPIALGFGAGGEARMPLGVSVAAGLATSTFLTLLVVPVVFTLFSDLQEKLRRPAGVQTA
ncbi:MAG: efflux RND transporter permease subunit [Gammaproteobacteria bacterium]|nr:MAG: efflux RND transporter permease subunit [Gammaproteobacteria bacterium]